MGSSKVFESNDPSDDYWYTDEVDDFIASQVKREQAATVAPWLRNYGPDGPYESQLKFHTSAAKFHGFSGPVGSGKSAALAREAIRLAYANPGRIGLVGAPTFPMLRDSSQRAIFDALELAEIPYVQHKSENSVVLAECGSKILFRSLENFERLRGTNLAWFGIDELTYCREEAWTRLEGRLRDPKARELKAFGVWTPNGFDWVYRKFIEHGAAIYEAIIARPGENTSLPPDYYDNLKRSYGDLFFQQEVLGEYLNLCAGRAYHSFNRANCVARQPFNPALPICWSLDFNINPMSSVICQIAGQSVNVLEEIVLPNSHTAAACRLFRERLNPYLAELRRGITGVVPITVRVYGDPAGNQRRTSAGADVTDWKIVQDHLQRDPSLNLQWFVETSHPSVKARVNAVNARLLNAEGVRRMSVDPSCKELIADFEQVTWAVDAHGNSTGELSKKDPKRTHITDALGYLVEYEFPLELQSGYRAEYLGA